MLMFIKQLVRYYITIFRDICCLSVRERGTKRQTAMEIRLTLSRTH